MASCACDFGHGLRTCHCAACHETFTGVTAFDAHHVENEDGVTVCLDPATALKPDGSLKFAAIRLTPEASLVWGRAAAKGGPAAPWGRGEK